jgi:hypothetical protein
MKPVRRLVDVVVTVLLIAVVAVSIYLAVTGQIPQEKQITLIGGAVLLAAIMLGGAFYKFRRKEGAALVGIDDANAVIQVSLPPIEAKAFTAMFLFAAIGCGIMILGDDLDGGDQIWPWCGLLLFGGLSAFFLFRKQTVSLRLSPEGIDYTVFKTGTIAWRDIQAVAIKTMGKINYIALDLRNPQDYLARRPKSFWHLLEHLPLAKPFTFSPPSAGVSPESIVKAIEVRLSTFGRSGSGRVTLE